ncbi:hypothetical protein B0H11DRAFT_1926349 [Mycena galericulata]|nr:hypothetical protein B0H11DRAFT_1926349 [Mycena galericulata]
MYPSTTSPPPFGVLSPADPDDVCLKLRYVESLGWRSDLQVSQGLVKEIRGCMKVAAPAHGLDDAKHDALTRDLIELCHEQHARARLVRHPCRLPLPLPAYVHARVRRGKVDLRGKRDLGPRNRQILLVHESREGERDGEAAGGGRHRPSLRVIFGIGRGCGRACGWAFGRELRRRAGGGSTGEAAGKVEAEALEGGDGTGRLMETLHVPLARLERAVVHPLAAQRRAAVRDHVPQSVVHRHARDSVYAKADACVKANKGIFDTDEHVEVALRLYLPRALRMSVSTPRTGLTWTCKNTAGDGVKRMRTEDAPFQEKKHVGVADVYLVLEQADRTHQVLWWAAVKHDEKGPFAVLKSGGYTTEDRCRRDSILGRLTVLVALILVWGAQNQ